MTAPSMLALLDPVLRQDPYPTYRQWRETAPISGGDGQPFIVTRQQDCSNVLRDPRFGHAEADQTGPLNSTPPQQRSFLGMNPPDHTRLRGLVSKAFTRKVVERLAPMIEQTTAELIEAALAEGRSGGAVNLMDAIARPLPVAVISELFDVPVEDRELIVAWSHDMARGLDPDFLIPEGVRERQFKAREEFRQYMLRLADKRRDNPGEDLLSGLVQVQDAGDVLSEAELLTTCILLLIAGHETTVNLIGNGTLALLRNPEQLARLRAEPALADRAVEEFLRYDPPVQFTARIALQDTTVGSLDAPAGSAAILLFGAANRDPEVCADPDRLDIGREPSRHLAFGHGPHFCLGAPLARLEGRIMFQALARLDVLEPVGDPTYNDNIILRGMRELPVRIA
ncbi:cytochrome P450 [Kutzneria kofuensis]|uniref:Cytochrome P450 n=1 Tax=Kutzneria kofuensis TaxID=103725 RepID=A0A7W9KB03_9PSEU|nr:cytochrome P450 [Kutzneria kofuensis]MBB5889272.1 cytochrome P450 [Kutzneria kofuensis]